MKITIEKLDKGWLLEWKGTSGMSGREAFATYEAMMDRVLALVK